MQEAQFGVLRLAMDQREGDIAAEDGAALAGEAVGERAGEGVYAGDGGNAEHEAGEEDAEAAHAAAQVTQRKAQRYLRAAE